MGIEWFCRETEESEVGTRKTDPVQTCVARASRAALRVSHKIGECNAFLCRCILSPRPVRSVNAMPSFVAASFLAGL